MNRIINADALQALRELPDNVVDCCISSPPYYGLRDYGVAGQIGLEKTPEEYISRLVDVFAEVRRVLREDGTLWVNIGDSYAGSQGRWSGVKDMNSKQSSNRGSYGFVEHEEILSKKWQHPTIKSKDMIGIPWMLAFALRADGWYLRQDIIWQKPNPMPESIGDRCTKAHEYIFLLSKNRKYYFNQIKESCSSSNVDNFMRNKRSVWTVSPKPFKGAHFATFPPELIRPCVLAGSRIGGVVLDPFVGSGTTGLVAAQHGREFVGIEINPDYVKLAQERLLNVQQRML